MQGRSCPRFLRCCRARDPAGSAVPRTAVAAGHEALRPAGSALHPLSHLLPSVLPVPVWHSRAGPKGGPVGSVTAPGHRPLGAPSLLRGRLPLQGGQGLPYCCAGFVTARLMPVIGSFYHLNVSPQLLKPASARIYYLADKYKCRFILSPCSSERNENVSKIVKIK